ncbi:MAG: hypothetical protein K9M07_03400 [Simkaniaceae bacterium]|nr:hypothetical protein [Simkaniaceae bacterium]
MQIYRSSFTCQNINGRSQKDWSWIFRIFTNGSDLLSHTQIYTTNFFILTIGDEPTDQILVLGVESKIHNMSGEEMKLPWRE